MLFFSPFLAPLITTSATPTHSYVTHDIRLTISVKQSNRKFELLNRAVQTHTRLTREAATGKGIDRHLMGLRLVMKPEDGEAADLFSDALFERSQTWKLSTSGLSAGYQFRGTGFGAGYPDGYGINCECGSSACDFRAAFPTKLGDSDADGICLCLFFSSLFLKIWRVRIW